jgi:hypothetical protein
MVRTFEEFKNIWTMDVDVLFLWMSIIDIDIFL